MKMKMKMKLVAMKANEISCSTENHLQFHQKIQLDDLPCVSIQQNQFVCIFCVSACCTDGNAEVPKANLTDEVVTESQNFWMTMGACLTSMELTGFNAIALDDASIGDFSKNDK